MAQANLQPPCLVACAALVMAAVRGGESGFNQEGSGQGAIGTEARDSLGSAMAASLAAIVQAGASRQVVAAAFAAGLRSLATAGGKEQEKEPAGSDEDVEARVQALRVVLEAQVSASKAW